MLGDGKGVGFEAGDRKSGRQWIRRSANLARVAQV